MPFFRDLCSGIVGNFRNCMTTPLTRKKLLIISGIVLTIILLVVIIAVSVPSASPDPKGRDALNNVPLVEGNSDLKAYLTSHFTVSGYNYSEHFNETTIGAQVIATSVACEAQFKDAVSQTIDQLDFIKRLVDESSGRMKIIHSAQELTTNKDNKYRSIVLALGGGHSIDNRLSTLRSYFNLGVRVVSLASIDCSNPWAKSIGDNKNFTLNGTSFLNAVVAEMNRLGVAIDLAGSDRSVQETVLSISKAPVIFRGIGFNSIVAKDINLDGNILDQMKIKDSLAMLSLDCSLIVNGTDCSQKDFIGFLTKAKDRLGVTNIGIGGLLYPNGKMPKGLGFADFPSLFDTLKNNGWSISDLEHLAGNNFINFLQKVEKVAKKQADQQPNEAIFDIDQLKINDCYTPPPTPNSESPTEYHSQLQSLLQPHRQSSQPPRIVQNRNSYSKC